MTTVAIQNAVNAHQLGTATALMNFFRSLGGALIVAIFGAILLSGGVAGGLHGAAATAAGPPSAAVVAAFGWMFAAAALGFLGALMAIVAMEERPMRASVGAEPGAD